MSELKFNITELYQTAFGIQQKMPVRFVQPNESKEQAIIVFDIPTIETPDEALELTDIGTPIVFPITFVGRKYKAYDTTGQLVDIQMEDFRLPASAFCEISRAKNATKTDISGATGSVKETYGLQDWSINIKGVLMNEPSHKSATTALQQKQIIKQWESLADSIIVESDLLKNIDIYSLYIDSINFGQVAGSPSILSFTMQCYSDEPIEILL